MLYLIAVLLLLVVALLAVVCAELYMIRKNRDVLFARRPRKMPRRKL